MALTVGTAPFGHQPGGVWNRPMPERPGLIWFEDSPRRIRGELGGVTVVDSTHAKLLHEHAHLPVYYFPEDDVRMDLLRPSDHRTRCPWKGEASHWTLEAGGQVAENAAWSYPEPIEGAPPLAGYVAFYWNKLDRWLEEDEPAIVTRATRITASTCSRARAASGCCWTARSWRRATGRWRSSRPACRPGGIYRRTTSGWTC